MMNARGGRIATLECDHCGGVAVTCGNSHGLFSDDDSGPCETCGMPGSVVIEDYSEEGEDAETSELCGAAVWLSDETARCTRADCNERASDARSNCRSPMSRARA